MYVRYFQISELFGGMEVCGLSIVVSKDGREYILGANDSTLPLMGESQEDDRRHIADLVVTRMQVIATILQISGRVKLIDFDSVIRTFVVHRW